MGLQPGREPDESHSIGLPAVKGPEPDSTANSRFWLLAGYSEETFTADLPSLPELDHARLMPRAAAAHAPSQAAASRGARPTILRPANRWTAHRSPCGLPPCQRARL